MIANWLKAVWILLGATVAAVGAAYVTGVFEPAPDKPMVEAAVQRSPDDKVAAVQAGDASDSAMTAKDQPKAGDGGEQVASLEPQDKASSAAADDDGVVVPAFDLVRVEANGSVVIAGTAAAGSSVEVISGATVIGNAMAGDNGDFAVVLDDPLKPGDYTIVLRSSGPGDLVATSAQTAIISVPETEAGQVLALVEEPGAPSRLITVPTAKLPAATAKGDRPKAAEPEKKEGVTSADEPAKPEMATKAEPAAAPKEELAKAEKPAAPAKMEETPAAPKAMETAKAEERAPDAEKPADQQMAAVEEPKAAAPEPMAEKPAAPKIAVEAVEIEGRKIFVAGFAEPGMTVRVYANDILLGQAGVSAAGRFLIEAEKDLPVGDYIVRADMLGKDKAEVLARAAVPFEREPGEKVAAVAAPAEPAAKPVETAMTEPATKPEDAPAQPKTQPGQTTEARPDADPDGVAPKTGSGEMGASLTTENDSAKAAEMAMADPAPSDDIMAGGSDSTAEPGEDMAATDEVLSPKLQNVGGAVIIRRGDTLWRLSRRVYGRGIRYTTIYLANENQISDPDMIWPGQVFSVPGETKEGESADMSAVAEQTTSPEDVVTR